MRHLFTILFSFIFTVNFFSQQIFTSSEENETKSLIHSTGNHFLFAPQNQLEPDWIYEINAPVLSSLKSADIDNDGIKEIIASSYDTTDGNAYGAGLIYVINTSGNDYHGFPKRIVGAPIPSTVSIGDIDQDSTSELTVGSWDKLYVYNNDGSAQNGFPKNFGTSQTATLFDLDKDGFLEIIYPSDNSRLYVFKHDGSSMDGFPVTLPENPGSPAVADIDNDDEYEIVFGTFQGPVGPDPFNIYAVEIDGTITNGFPVSLSGVIKSTPAIGDLDNDGNVEIVVCSYDDSDFDSLYVIDHTGNFLPGFPVGVETARLSSAALGDLDGDDDLEIVIGGMMDTETLFAFHHDGSEVRDFPVQLIHDGPSFNINSSPLIADIDGDTTNIEIVVKGYNYIFAIHSDTTTVKDFPYFIDDENHTGTHSPSPLIDDFDNDGDVELVFASNYGKLHYFDMKENYNDDYAYWKSYKHDKQNSGSILPIDIYTGIEDETNQIVNDFKLYQNYPNPFNPSTVILYAVSSKQHVSLKVYDVLGNEIETLVNEVKDSGIYEVKFDAENLSSGIYFYRLTSGKYNKVKKMVLIR